MKSRFARLRDQGLLTTDEIEEMIGHGSNRASYWEKLGVLKVVKLGQHYERLYYRPTEAELAGDNYNFPVMTIKSFRWFGDDIAAD
jgi:hypothetical protein